MKPSMTCPSELEQLPVGWTVEVDEVDEEVVGVYDEVVGLYDELVDVYDEDGVEELDELHSGVRVV